MVWRRSVMFQGERTKIGDPIPASLANNRGQLRRFWERQYIELAPAAEPEAPETADAETDTDTETEITEDDAEPAAESAEAPRAPTSKQGRERRRRG